MVREGDAGYRSAGLPLGNLGSTPVGNPGSCQTLIHLKKSIMENYKKRGGKRRKAIKSIKIPRGGIRL